VLPHVIDPRLFTVRDWTLTEYVNYFLDRGFVHLGGMVFD
jgi:hypothetical protein